MREQSSLKKLMSGLRSEQEGDRTYSERGLSMHPVASYQACDTQALMLGGNSEV